LVFADFYSLVSHNEPFHELSTINGSENGVTCRIQNKVMNVPFLLHIPDIRILSSAPVQSVMDMLYTSYGCDKIGSSIALYDYKAGRLAPTIKSRDKKPDFLSFF
jgi:hypothetical protein